VLGTPTYMSPEQARGQPVDKRTDIWAFGCVVYEMLTGHPAFARDTVSDTIAAILEREPDWTPWPADAPAAIRNVVARCLEKTQKRRLRDIGDFRALVDDVGAAVHGTREQPSAIRTQTRWWVAGAAVALLAASVAALYLRSPSSPASSSIETPRR
jgi:serine/threonine protein kinase